MPRVPQLKTAVQELEEARKKLAAREVANRAAAASARIQVRAKQQRAWEERAQEGRLRSQSQRLRDRISRLERAGSRRVEETHAAPSSLKADRKIVTTTPPAKSPRINRSKTTNCAVTPDAAHRRQKSSSTTTGSPATEPERRSAGSSNWSVRWGPRNRDVSPVRCAEAAPDAANRDFALEHLRECSEALMKKRDQAFLNRFAQQHAAAERKRAQAKARAKALREAKITGVLRRQTAAAEAILERLDEQEYIGSNSPALTPGSACLEPDGRTLSVRTDATVPAQCTRRSMTPDSRDVLDMKRRVKTLQQHEVELVRYNSLVYESALWDVRTFRERRYTEKQQAFQATRRARSANAVARYHEKKVAEFETMAIRLERLPSR